MCIYTHTQYLLSSETSECVHILLYMHMAYWRKYIYNNEIIYFSWDYKWYNPYKNLCGCSKSKIKVHTTHITYIYSYIFTSTMIIQYLFKRKLRMEIEQIYVNCDLMHNHGGVSLHTWDHRRILRTELYFVTPLAISINELQAKATKSSSPSFLQALVISMFSEYTDIQLYTHSIANHNFLFWIYFIYLLEFHDIYNVFDNICPQINMFILHLS